MPESRQPAASPAIRDDEIARLWNYLWQVRFLSVTSLSGDDVNPSDNEHTVGSGTVTVRDSHPGTLVFEEQGAWDHHSQRIAFSNKLAWTLVPESGTIRCSHLRYGDDNPEYLAEFYESKNQTWHGIEPYLCADDRYEGLLELAPTTLTLTWKITGPHKNQVIRCVYT